MAIKCSPQNFASNYGKGGFSAILRHCAIHRNVQVRIHIPYWSQADPSFISLGLYFLSTLRAGTSLAAQLAQNTSLSSLPISELDLPPELTPMPCNLRLFPKEERFNKKMFERSYRKNPLIRLPTTQAAIGEVIKLAEDWFQNGL